MAVTTFISSSDEARRKAVSNVGGAAAVSFPLVKGILRIVCSLVRIFSLGILGDGPLCSSLNGGGFIHLVNTGTVTTYDRIFAEAAATWSSIITSSLPTILIPAGFPICDNSYAFTSDTEVNGVVICYKFDYIGKEEERSTDFFRALFNFFFCMPCLSILPQI